VRILAQAADDPAANATAQLSEIPTHTWRSFLSHAAEADFYDRPT
jgi:hypothetical protein